MPSRLKSLIQISDLTLKQVNGLFSLAEARRIKKQETKMQKISKNPIALIFFESSTRTRMSFEMASKKMGLDTILLDGKNGSSLEKGETLEDTVLNISAMDPACLVIRSNESLDMVQMQKKISQPIINAGWGSRGHPTQALLDIYTLSQKRKRFDKEKLLIVGDIRHSRVASSHFELAKILNYKVGICGPQEFLPTQVQSHVKVFKKLSEGLEWCTSVMALRVQWERHKTKYSLSDYREEFGIHKNHAKKMTKDQWILHPGPVNKNVELDEEVFWDKKSLILEQVKNGVIIRRALLRAVLEGFL